MDTYSSGSFVGMEQARCPICRNKHDTGAILLHRRMQKVFPGSGRGKATSIQICDPCIEQGNKGFVALVGADPAASTALPNGNLKPEDAHYTEEYLWVHRAVAEQLFNIDISEHPFVYIEPEAIEMVKEKVNDFLARQGEERSAGETEST